ncbi:MAG: hypothetical protein WD737_11760 [Gemmatimonadota bacterium]
MPVPTLMEFQVATAHKGKLNKRGTVFALVDGLLEDWHRRKQIATFEEKIAILYQLLKEAVRANGRIKPAGSVGKKNALAHRRKYQLENLAGTVFDELDRVSPSTARGLRRFESRKEDSGRVGNPIQLAGGYGHERAHYLSTGKQFAYSASAVHGLHEGLRGRQTMSEKSRKLSRKSFDSLTLSDFEFLAWADYEKNVAYYNKVERLKYMLVPDGHGGFEDLKGNAVHMNTWRRVTMAADLQIYAIDRYGNLFAREAEGDPENRFINHSSLNAGREVMCAGCIWITNGRLRHIDNNSGHYLPSADQLREALNYLIDEGIDISETRLMEHAEYKRTGVRKMFFALSWLNGKTVPDFTDDDARRLQLELS